MRYTEPHNPDMTNKKALRALSEEFDAVKSRRNNPMPFAAASTHRSNMAWIIVVLCVFFAILVMKTNSKVSSAKQTAKQGISRAPQQSQKGSPAKQTAIKRVSTPTQQLQEVVSIQQTTQNRVHTPADTAEKKDVTQKITPVVQKYNKEKALQEARKTGLLDIARVEEQERRDSKARALAEQKRKKEQLAIYKGESSTPKNYGRIVYFRGKKSQSESSKTYTGKLQSESD